MTPTRYRRGAYVIDTRTYRIGVVMDHVGGFTQVRPPHGGREWDCPPEVLRAAMTQERRAAGITAADEYRTAWASGLAQLFADAATGSGESAATEEAP